jgi:hypothetical protein
MGWNHGLSFNARGAPSGPGDLVNISPILGRECPKSTGALACRCSSPRTQVRLGCWISLIASAACNFPPVESNEIVLTVGGAGVVADIGSGGNPSCPFCLFILSVHRFACLGLPQQPLPRLGARRVPVALLDKQRWTFPVPAQSSCIVGDLLAGPFVTRVVICIIRFLRLAPAGCHLFRPT